MLRHFGGKLFVLIGAFVVFSAVLRGIPTSMAAPLGEDSCERLRTEQKALTVLGIDKYFEQGADWVRANLTVADFNLVRRYVTVYEQLKFRCPVKKQAKSAKAKAYKGPIPPMPVRGPERIKRTTIPAAKPAPG